jgi:predicted ATPase with chaperone activity
MKVRFATGAMIQHNLSARAYHHILKLSRTIADLAGSDKIQSQHLAEACSIVQKSWCSNQTIYFLASRLAVK